jgi:hypothetical protein
VDRRRLTVVLAVATLSAPGAARAAGPAWLAPEDHAQPPGLERVYDEKIGVNAAGDAAAVWQSGPPDASSETLVASIRPAGGTWSPPQEISFPADSTDGINVDVDNAGDVLVTWYPFDAASQINSPIYYRYHPAGGSWGNITLLTGGDSSAPFAAFDGGTTATLAYRDFSHALPVVRWLTIAGGTTVSAAETFPLPAVPDGFSEWTNQCAPYVAVNHAGAAAVVWSAQLDWGRWVVLGAIRPAAGRPFGAPHILPLDGVATENGRDAVDPEAAIAGDGRIVVSWIRGGAPCDFSGGDLGGMNVDSATYNPLTGLWTKRGPLLPAPVYRIPRWHVDDNRGWHRVLGMDDAGNATLAWLQEPNPPAQDCDGVNLHSPDGVVAAAALPAASGEWGSLRTDLGSNQDIAIEDKDCLPLGVELSMNPAGDTAATWLEDVSPTQRREVARVKPRGSDWAARQSVSGVVTNQLDSPGLVMDAFGDAVTDYRLGPETENGVLQTAAFDGSGPQLRDVRLPQAATMLDQLTFSVNPFDVLSSPGTPTWVFGDGTSATGALVTHAYADGGSYTVTVMAADSLGNVTQIPYHLSVASLPPPAATAGSASAVTQTGAVLAGTVNTNGLATSYRFDWGTTTAYGQATAAGSLQPSRSDVPVQATLSGLAPSTLYHYRVTATSSKGTTVTEDHTFRTLSPLPPRDLRLSKVGFHVTWHQSRAFGTITVAGSAQAAGVVSIQLRLAGHTRQRLRFAVPGATFTRRYKVPQTLVPGRYELVVVGSASGPIPFATPEYPAVVVLGRPPEGVVDHAWLTTTKNGPPAVRVPGPRRSLWAYFHLAARPRLGSKVVVQWFVPHHRGPVVSKRSPNLTRVSSSIRSGSAPLAKGVYRCVLRANSRIVKQVVIRIT